MRAVGHAARNRHTLRQTAPTYAYGEFEGLRLPVSGAAVWTMADGTELPYIEVELTEVEYDPSVPA